MSRLRWTSRMLSLVLLPMVTVTVAVGAECPAPGDLATALEAAALVVTAKVEAVVAASHLSLRVKRVVRGHSSAPVIPVQTPPLCSSCGGGDQRLSSARVGQTAIFLVRQDLSLLCPPVAISIRNLNIISSGAGGHGHGGDDVAMMVRGWRRGRGATVALLSLALLAAVVALTSVFLTYSSRKPASLVTSGACPSSCPSQLSPVCGSDDVTYRNLCQLQRKACAGRVHLHLQLHTVKMAHLGPCGDVEKPGGRGSDEQERGEEYEDPCETLRCPVTSRCVVRGEGSLAAACECEAGPCPPEAGVGAAPVCGSDGHTYASECELRQAACRAPGGRLQVRLRGPCDPCGGTTCPWPSVCRLDAERRPRCVCGETCPPETAPVCASDGNTYASECALRLHGCRLRASAPPPLRILYRGPCSSGRNPCDGLRCGQGECQVDGGGVAHCRCPDAALCEDVYRPVCASDGRTLSSDCHLRRDACLRNVTLRHHGPCSGQDLDSDSGQPSLSRRGCSAQVDCDFYGVCKEDSGGVAVCSCDLPCPQRENAAVCGSDGKTHSSLCQLQRTSCLHRRNITLVHQGPCRDDPCGDVRCDLGATCEVSPEDDLPRCVCRFRCGVRERAASPPVCGSDRRSYASLCDLHAEACRKKKHQLKPLGTNASLCSGPGKVSRCQSSPYGCCRDGKTPAKGPALQGCARKCFCNRLGTWKGRCDGDGVPPRCVCRKGVVGARCNRCDAGFWGFSLGRRRGCQPCQCSPLGSARQDCHQMSGRCSCLPGVQGRRCQICSSPDKVLGPSGCAAHSGDAGATDRPSTLEQEGVPQSKSTRHLHMQRYHQIHRPGPEELATPHPWPSPAAVGDVCSYDAQCGAAVTLSVCQEGVCRCRGGLVASEDGHVCREFNSAGFDGGAWMRLPCLRAYHKLRLDLEIVAFAPEGVILYNQHHEDGSGDFVALALSDGHVVFRYNLGSGVVTLTSREKVTLGRRHRVSARRYHRDGALRLDDADDVTGQSQGFLKALDLQQDLFLGHLPPGASRRVVENAGSSRGLVGCVISLQVGQQPLGLHHGAAQVLEAHGVRECRVCDHGPECDEAGQRKRTTTTTTMVDPCARDDPCVAGAACSSLPGGGGFHCTRNNGGGVSAPTMRLDGSSTVELPRLEGVSRSLALDVRFLASKPDGVLVFSGQRHGGDLVALLLLQGKLHFRFDLGSGPALLRSPDAVKLGRWHRARASRVDRGGTLQLDDGRTVRGFSAPPLEELNVDLPLYLGGIPKYLKKTPLGSTPLAGLVGAVQSLVINGREVLEGLTRCNGTGGCLGTDEAVRFDDGKSSLRLPLRTRNSGNVTWRWEEEEEGDQGGPSASSWSTDVAMSFRTTDDQAQLLRFSEDDVRVVLVHGFVQMSVSDGSSVRSKMAVNDGRWHSLSLQRRPRRLQLLVDASTLSLVTSSSKSAPRRQWLWLGGAGFGGCIAKVVLGADKVDVAALASRQWGGAMQQGCHDNDVQ